MQGADGKLSIDLECTRRASTFNMQGEGAGGGEGAKWPAWLLRGIPNVMSLLIPSGNTAKSAAAGPESCRLAVAAATLDGIGL